MLDLDALNNALRAGLVSYPRTLGVDPIIGAMGRVEHEVGEEAIVYPLGRGGVPRQALRFARDPANARTWPRRYADIEAEAGALLPWLPQEMTLLESDRPGEPAMALVYRWREGTTLDRAVAGEVPHAMLSRVVDSLADLAGTLRQSPLVHGDIAPGNIIVAPDGTVSLVDLDHMAPARDASLNPRRRPGYRIPSGEGSPVAEDAFGLLVLLTSVAVVSSISAFDRDDDPDRPAHAPLVFTSWDLLDPSRSELVRTLEAEVSGVAGVLLEHLIGACASPPERVPGILDEALLDLERARRWTQGSRGTTAPPPSPAQSVGASWTPSRDVPDSWMEATWRNVAPDDGWEALAATAPAPADVSELLARLAALGEDEVVSPRNRLVQRQRREMRRSELAQVLRHALITNDRDVLVRLAMSGDIAQLGESSRADVVKVLRALSYDQIARAVASDRDDAILVAVDPEVFPDDADLDHGFRERVALARRRDAWTERVLAAVRDGDRAACARLVESAPTGGLDRLPAGTRARLKDHADVSALVEEIRAATQAGDLGRIVGPMARLSLIAGAWSDLVDLQAIVTAVGYPRIRQRVVDQLKADAIDGRDHWLVDCVVAAGDLEAVLASAGVEREVLEGALAKAPGRRAQSATSTTHQR